jgi:6-phosphogluconolactonase
MNKKLRLIACSLVLLALTACGGGGADDGSSANGKVSGLSVTPPASNDNTNNSNDNTSNNTAGFAYVANNGSEIGSQTISAFTIDSSTGRLSEIAGSPFALGYAPRAVTAHPSGRFIYVLGASLDGSGTGSINAYTVNPTTGALTIVNDPLMIAGSIPFSVTVDPSGKFAYAVGGGTHPWVSAYTINATTGALLEVAGSPFASQEWGPQSVTVDGSGKFVYVANPGWNFAVEDSISAFAINATTGALSEVAGSPFPAEPARSDPYHVIGPWAITSEPSGRFAYTANYNTQSVFAYAINPTTGALTGISDVGTAGYLPVAVTVDPSGKFVYAANLNPAYPAAGAVTSYAIDATNGTLTSIGAPVTTGLQPASVTVHPSGRFLYVANTGSNDVSGYTIDSNTGALTSIGTVAAGSYPVSIVTIRCLQ